MVTNVSVIPCPASVTFNLILVYHENLYFSISTIYVIATRRVECSDYDGNERRTLFNTTGKPFSIVFQNGVAYYTTVHPFR